MRIRKRKVPLPLSQLSPIPLSDPHLFSRSPVVVQLDHNNFGTVSPLSSDHLTTPTCGSVTDLGVRNHNNYASATTNNNNVSVPIITGDEGVQMSNDDSSNASITTTCAPSYDNNDNNYNNINNGLLLPPPRLPSNNEGVGGRWCDGDRVVPLKKRRTMVVKCGNVVENEDEEEKQMIKGSGVLASSDVTTVVTGVDNTQAVMSGGNKKGGSSKRGNTIMEGSRCSRVNGRGWRCCQQTLVGYSLCEHHLGKGRLRSMTGSATAKSRSKKKMGAASSNATYPVNTTEFALGSHDKVKEKLDDDNNGDDDDDDDEKKKKMERMSSFGSNSKRNKLGVVKARSLSSLLGQTNTMNNNIVGDQLHHANMHQQEKISN